MVDKLYPDTYIITDNPAAKYTDYEYDDDEMYIEYDEITKTVWLRKKQKECTTQEAIQKMLDMGFSISQINQLLKQGKDK